MKQNTARDVRVEHLDSTLERVAARIAPIWPLDRFVAVNPLWGFVDQPIEQAAATLATDAGIPLTMPRQWYRDLWHQGRLERRHVEQAMRRLGVQLPFASVFSRIHVEGAPVRRRRTVAALADEASGQPRWSRFVVEDTSRFCAVWFDRSSEHTRSGLYAAWRASTAADRSPGLLLGARDHGARARRLPPTPEEAISTCLIRLGVEVDAWEPYLMALLFDVLGWASWCSWHRFTARLEGGDDDSILELLAVRLCWEVLVLEAQPDLATAWRQELDAWSTDPTPHARESRTIDWILQTATEIALHEQVASGLAPTTGSAPEQPDVQAAFCIDVRSEPLRRALEQESPRVATLGFAGFFGVPMAYRPVGARDPLPHLPAPLLPRLLAVDAGVPDLVARRRVQRIEGHATRVRLQRGPTSAFTFVESFGLGYAARLLTDGFGWTRPTAVPARAGLTPSEHQARSPRLDGAVPVEERVRLAASVLRGMSLTRGFAPLVVLVGHGSRTTNNPHAACYECGACCGQAGDVNARVVAALLNEPDVRAGLAGLGIDVPASTWFLAGLHDTTTDEVRLLERDRIPAHLEERAARLEQDLGRASIRSRERRAPQLGVPVSTPESVHRALDQRARDWAQVRPEWGLAGNACFVAAPRERTKGVDLQGRVFLHEYRWEEDEGFAVLENLLTAPVVVAHWINFQYYASTVDNRRLGSGDKVLHNVVGGSIGVLEGNGGDLRIGLPRQALHDGRRLVHEPLRLGVFVEAPREALEAALARHDVVRHLVDHGWIHLYRIGQEGQIESWYQRAFHPFGGPSACP